MFDTPGLSLSKDYMTKNVIDIHIQCQGFYFSLSAAILICRCSLLTSRNFHDLLEFVIEVHVMQAMIILYYNKIFHFIAGVAYVLHTYSDNIF